MSNQNWDLKRGCGIHYNNQNKSINHETNLETAVLLKCKCLTSWQKQKFKKDQPRCYVLLHELCGVSTNLALETPRYILKVFMISNDNALSLLCDGSVYFCVRSSFSFFNPWIKKKTRKMNGCRIFQKRCIEYQTSNFFSTIFYTWMKHLKHSQMNLRGKKRSIWPVFEGRISLSRTVEWAEPRLWNHTERRSLTLILKTQNTHGHCRAPVSTRRRARLFGEAISCQSLSECLRRDASGTQLEIAVSTAVHEVSNTI